jgi:ABC-type transport system involved in Fe-S cluster assembly fused permease/ATPase subunit
MQCTYWKCNGERCENDAESNDRCRIHQPDEEADREHEEWKRERETEKAIKQLELDRGTREWSPIEQILRAILFYIAVSMFPAVFVITVVLTAPFLGIFAGLLGFFVLFLYMKYVLGI